MNGYEKRTIAKKNAIIEAARELFVTRGMHDVSISEIAKRAGVSQVSIYNYFGDKNTLAKDFLASYIETVIQKYSQIMALDISFTEKIEQIIQMKSDAIREATLSFFNKKALDDKIFLQVYQEAFLERMKALFCDFIESGKKEGAIDQTIRNEAYMSYFMTSLTLMQQPGFMAETSDYKIGLMHLFLYGIVGKK